MCSFRDLRVRLRRAPSAYRMVLRCHNAGHGVEFCGFLDAPQLLSLGIVAVIMRVVWEF